MEVHNMNYISINLLKCHPKNQEYYNDLPPEKYEEIKRSIEINGIRDPLKVLPDYTIIAGHQRFKIAQELELTQVPVVIMDIDQKEAEYILIADNEERRQEDNDPIKKAKRAKFLKEYWGVKNGRPKKLPQNEEVNKETKTSKDIAEAVGTSSKNLNRLLKLNDLIPDLQNLVSAGKLGTCAAEQLSYLTKKDQQMLLDTLGEEITHRTLVEVKELRSKVQEGSKTKTLMERKQAELLQQIEDAEKTISEYEDQICQLEKQLEENEPEVIEKAPEDYAKLKTTVTYYEWELEQAKNKLDELNKANQDLKKELDEKKSVIRSFTAAQIQAASRKKIRTLLTVMVQDIGKHLNHAQIEIESFSMDDDEELYNDVVSCAKILRQAADQLEAVVRTRKVEVIDIDPEH
jgi:ParB family chromosome partitioning protein